MKYIITGGAGFIGSYLAETLVGAGKEVVIIDNLSTGSLDNLKGIWRSEKLLFISKSVQEVDRWEEFISRNDVIIHLAATVGVNKVVTNSLETADNNFLPTQILLGVALKYNCSLFLASTSEVYGELNEDSSCEVHPLVVPFSHCGRAAYVLGKLMSEHYCLNYHKKYGLKVIVGRLFNVTGERQVDTYGMVIPTFIRQALAGEPITLYGKGNQTRSFANVHDIVRAILLLLETDKAFGEVFNIGAEESITIAHLAGYIKEVTRSSSQVVYLNYPASRQGSRDIHHRKPSLEKIKSCIKWKPLVPWQITVDAIINHHMAIRQSNLHMQTEAV
jgi:UDP-glucose 4-epimerase